MISTQLREAAPQLERSWRLSGEGEIAAHYGEVLWKLGQQQEARAIWARALVACTSNDALNLEIGLTAQSVAEASRDGRPLRLVLRCFDTDIAHRIHAVSDNYTLLSEAKIAAEVFVKRALAEPAT